MSREEVSEVENKMRVLVAPAASCRFARLGLLGNGVVQHRGTDVFATRWCPDGNGRIQTPSSAVAQGTSVSAAGLGEGMRQGYGHRAIRIRSNQTVNPTTTTSNPSTKQNVVVDDIPGVPSWSPPV
jgi:hypothetical protein